MQYDFESYIDRRHTTSYKWNAMTNACPDIPEGVIPLSVADMELKNPPEIMEGLRDLLDPDKLILGYAGTPQSFRDAVCLFMKKRHSWDIEPEWIVPTAGVVPAFYNAVLAFTRPGEGVIVMPPVYFPFFGAAEQEGRKAVYCPLLDAATAMKSISTFWNNARDILITAFCFFAALITPLGASGLRKNLRRLERFVSEMMYS